MVMASHLDAARFSEQRNEDNSSSLASNHFYEEASSLLLAAAHKRIDRHKTQDEDEGTDRSAKDKSGDKGERSRESLERADKIVKSAESLRGQSLWKDYPEKTRQGELGCAISVSKALKAAGIDVGDELGVWKLENKLKAKNWTKHPLDEAQPGDVAIGHSKVHGTNHIGIISASRSLWNNSSRTLSDPRWANEPVSIGLRPGWLFQGYENRYVLRPNK